MYVLSSTCRMPSPPLPLFHQGLTVPSVPSSAAQQIDTQNQLEKATGGEAAGEEQAAGSTGAASESSGESRGGKKAPRWWVPERLRPASEELVS